MNTIHHAKTNRLVAVFLGVAAAAAVTPALLVAGAGTAHADCYSGDLQYSYYCSPASGAQGSGSLGPAYTPVQPAFGYNNLPGCSGGALSAIAGALSGDGC